ncbi:MAG: type II secretion system minor pseudopilin GspK [Rhizobacter sp.]|nr:type II secretion system minor pseudopilin GspK [Rhizobacter sp.]
MRRSPPAPAHAQRGAALLLAMIIVTLIATLAVSMVWQQWRAVQTETAERARAQSAWILSGALDWAGLILREDKRDFDHPSDIWGTPLAEARLSSFISVDKDNNADDSGPEAFLSGSMVDAQSRFNLRNLLDDKFQISNADLAAFHRLCENVNVAVSVADVIASGLQQAYAPAGSPGTGDDPPLPPKRIADLVWLGVDEQALRRLEPYIALLPEQTSVNVNTAEREVIAAVIPGLNIGDAERLVQYRQRTPFKKRDDIMAQLPGVLPQSLVRVDVVTRYFEVRGRLRLDDRVLEQRSLVQRNGRVITVLHSELVNSTEAAR